MRHAKVTEAERAAFGDSDAVVRAKRDLFDIQVDGVDAPGNRFTPLGRALFQKDLTARLARRLRLAHALAATPELAARPPTAPLILAGLPRTGSTLTHRPSPSGGRARPLLPNGSAARS